jgi:hypothetical protein
MTINSSTVLLVQNDVVQTREAGFDAWYLADHMPDRVAIPGFGRARRWRALEGGPRDLSLYEIDSPAVMSSPAYLTRLAQPTEGTRRYMNALIDMRRSVCNVRGAEGFADGGCAGLLPILQSPSDARLAALLAAPNWRPAPVAGIVACALLRTDMAASASDSVESRLRQGPDKVLAAAVWIEASTPDQARLAVNAARSGAETAGLDVGPSVLLRLVASFVRQPIGTD